MKSPLDIRKVYTPQNDLKIEFLQVEGNRVLDIKQIKQLLISNIVYKSFFKLIENHITLEKETLTIITEKLLPMIFTPRDKDNLKYEFIFTSIIDEELGFIRLWYSKEANTNYIRTIKYYDKNMVEK